MKSRLATLFVLISFLSSCSYQEIMDEKMFVDSPDVISEFHASFSETEAGVDSLETRTYIEEDSQTSRLNLYWNEDDRISVFCGNTLNQQYRFDGETGDNSGTFKLIAGDENVSYNPLDTPTNIAYYPYDENAEISENGVLVVNFPETQYYAENSFGPGANAMVAVTENPDDLDLKFKNVGGYLRFRFYGDDITIKSVVLKGNNGEKLSGKAIINCGYDMVPDLVMDNEAAEELTLRCNGGIKIGTTNESATEFWFVLPPVKFSKGFTITVTDINDGIFTKTTEKVFEVRRNTIKPVSAVKVETVVDWEAIYARERAALVEFYEATGGDHWTDNTNWCSDLPLNEWYGLAIDDNGRVSRLDLYNNNLSGSIPESIGNLSSLLYLNVQVNQLSGNIPSSIGDLSQLKSLILGSNNFSGGIPESIWDLTNLARLEITGIKAEGFLPSKIGKLTSLTYLCLGACNLKGPIPESFGNLINLETLQLQGNQLSGSIPESIGNLVSLRTLYLYRNQLTGEIPQSIGNLINVKHIELNSNQLTGNIPESIGNLKNLEGIALQSNLLTGNIPESIFNLDRLRALEIKDNNLSGSIPEGIGNLWRLTSLNLGGGNKFSGPIPESIGNLINLRELYLSTGELTGNIPESIGNLTKLTTLSLSGNKLEGSIPESIGNLTKLQKLYLYNNQLTGSIPESISNLKQLKIFDLKGHLELNSFSGNIPQDIGNLTNLTELDLAGFKLTGPIPESIGNMTNLTNLSLANNQLSGSIPESIGNLSRLTSLSLGGNQLTGSIPESIGKLSLLTSLALANNQLSGSIPESIGDLRLLTFLSLSNNMLSGKIPQSLLNHIVWKNYWGYILRNNDFDLSGVTITAPTFTFTDTRGNVISSASEYAKNKYTVLYLWASWCGYSLEYNETLKKLYDLYKDSGLEIISQGSASSDLPWIVRRTGDVIFHETGTVPEVIVVDNNGEVVLSSFLGDNRERLPFFLMEKLSVQSDELYTSTDYSHDGEVVKLQTASVGKGINLTFMGDAFVDKDMESGGLYEQKMKEGMESFFSVEPYKSLRNRFNVYAVKVVSPNAEFANGARHRINDDNAICFEYAQKIPDSSQNPPMITVIYNTDYYMGRSHCSLYTDGSYVCDILEPVTETNTTYLIPHESGGHGVARLLDEYVEQGYESKILPEEARVYLRNSWEAYGYGANVDYNDDESTVKWAHFLTDSRYTDEGLGIYEGAYLYGHGAYRPSDTSIMRGDSDVDAFNAPSREQIYKRVMLLSEGPDWVYDYEEFVEFDAPNRTAASAPATKSASVDSRNEHMRNHQPPTIIEGSWRDELKGR